MSRVCTVGDLYKTLVRDEYERFDILRDQKKNPFVIGLVNYQYIIGKPFWIELLNAEKCNRKLSFKLR